MTGPCDYPVHGRLCGTETPYRGWLGVQHPDGTETEYDCWLCKDHRHKSWKTVRRAVCERAGCGTPLTGRQIRWCSRVCWALGNRKVSYLWRILHDRQEGLCGICVLPLDVPKGFLSYKQDKAGLVYTAPFDRETLRPLVEVDHVVPVAGGGQYDMSNLRAAHRACNQGKKHKDLGYYRWQIGAFEHVVEERIQGVSPGTREFLEEPKVSAEDYRSPPGGQPRPVLEGQTALL